MDEKASSLQPSQFSFGPRHIEQEKQRRVVDTTINVIFAVSVFLTIFAFGYRYYMQTKLTAIQAEVIAAENASAIDDFVDVQKFDRVSRAASFLLQNRTRLQHVFEVLEETIKDPVIYNSFKLIAAIETKQISVTLGGISEKLAHTLLESNELKRVELFDDVSLTEIKVQTTPQGDVLVGEGVDFSLVITIPTTQVGFDMYDAVTPQLDSVGEVFGTTTPTTTAVVSEVATSSPLE